MKPRKSCSAWRACVRVLLPALLSGCATNESHLQRALLTDHNPAAHSTNAPLAYQLRCPDVVAVIVQGHEELSGLARIRPDGRLSSHPNLDARIEGLTCSEAATAIAEQLNLPHDQVQVQIKAYNSQVLYLFGEVNGLQRAIAYQGPETVVDLLQRVGGFNPGAARGNIQVVRSHIADGKAPEVFQVDLDAILLRHDQQTNIRLAPCDQVYIAESARSRLSCCFPPWLRPFYEALCGIRHSATTSPGKPPAASAPAFPPSAPDVLP